MAERPIPAPDFLKVPPLMQLRYLALLSAALTCEAGWTQGCFEDVCVGHSVADVAKLRWNPAQRRYVDPRYAEEWLRSTRYVGPLDALQELLTLSTFDEKTVHVLNRIEGVCGPGFGPRLKRGDETDDHLIAEIEPVPAADGLTQHFEVVAINAYLRQDKPANVLRLSQLCRTLLPPATDQSTATALRECELGWAQTQIAADTVLLSISHAAGDFTRINLQRIGGWFDERDPELLSRLPGCGARISDNR